MTHMLNPPKTAWKAPVQLLARLGSLNRRVKIEGFVDNIAANEVMGWAYDPQLPDRRIHIVARNEGKVIAEALADLPRDDLASAGKGDGRHGFRLRLPHGLAGLAVTVEAVARPRNQLLQRGQLLVPEPVAVAKPEKTKPVNRVGVIERLRGRQLSGWAVDPKHPDSPAQLDVFDGERYLGSATCTAARPDVGEAGGPPAARLFVFEAPDDGRPLRPDRLRARVLGTRHDLRRSKAFTESGEDSTSVEEPSTPVPPAVVDAPVDRAMRPAAAGRPPERIEAVAVIVCGPGSDGGGQHAAGAVTDNADASPRPTTLYGRSLAEAKAVLTQVLEQCSDVLLLAPGQSANGQDVRALLALRPFGDLWLFGVRPDLAPAFTYQSGAEIRSIAIRASALRAWPEAARVLAEGDLAALATWSLQQGHRWEGLPHDPVDGPPLRAAVAGRPLAAPPRRVTLGLWGAWGGSPTVGLVALLQGCEGLDVEILCPDEVLGASVRAMEAPSVASLDVRIVPQTDAPGSGAHLMALAGAATGQVVVLAHAGITYDRPDGLAEVLAWAQADGVGCVTVPVATASGPLCGLVLDGVGGQISVRSGRVPEAPRDCIPVLAAPAEFMVVSRRVLAVTEGLDARRFPKRHADLDLGIRLLERGRHCISIDRLRAGWSGEDAFQGCPSVIGAPEAFLLGIRPPWETGATAVLGRR
jgi:hypothetical protein